MSEWAIAKDGSCDFLPNMDLSNPEVVVMKDDTRVFRKIHKQPNSTNHIIEWCEMKGYGVMVWSLQTAQCVAPRVPDAPGTRQLRFFLPKRNSPGARRVINADMKRLRIPGLKSPSLERLGFTIVKRMVNTADKMMWHMVPPPPAPAQAKPAESASSAEEGKQATGTQ